MVVCFFSLILMFVLSMVARVARLPIGKSDSLLFPNPVISVRFQISHFNYSESQSSASSVESPDYFFLLTPHLFSYTLLCPHNLALSLPHSIIVFELCLSIQTNSSLRKFAQLFSYNHIYFASFFTSFKFSLKSRLIEAKLDHLFNITNHIHLGLILDTL